MLLKDKKGLGTQKKDWLIFLVLILVVITLRYPSLDLPLDHDSGANAFLARQMIRGEVLYDQFHPAHHLPGIYYTFKLAFMLFGDNPVSPKLLLILWVIASAWLLFLMGRCVFDEYAGILAAVFFVMVSSQDGLTGLTAEMEHFANLPLIGSLLLSIFLLQHRSPCWKFALVGILGAICILYKIIYVSSILAVLVGIFTLGWLDRNQIDGWKNTFARAAWLFLGLLLPLILVVGYFISIGLWDRFILVFTLGFKYLNDREIMQLSGMTRPFGLPIVFMSANNIALLVIGLIGTIRLFYRSFPLRNMQNVVELMSAVWLILTFAQIGIRGGGFVYYVLTAIPPLALMSAAEINKMIHQKYKNYTERLIIAFNTIILIASIAINFSTANRFFYQSYLLYKSGEISYDHFIDLVDKGWYTNIDRHILEYIETNTAKDDFIYLWGNNVQLYYYVDRLPPIDILWPSYVSGTGIPQRIFNPRTKYIIVDSADVFPRPSWLSDGLEKGYFLEVIIDGEEIYRRIIP